MMNIAVNPAKVPALPVEKSTGYWKNVGQRFMRDRVAVFALAGELDPRDAQIGQGFFDQAQHFGEL